VQLKFPARAGLAPFAALSASYFAHIGFFNPYLPLWLKDLGYSLVAIGLLTAVQSSTRVFAPYIWGWLSDHTGERVRLMRYCSVVAMLTSLALWISGLSYAWLLVVLLVMFTHTSSMMPMSEAAMAHHVSGTAGFDAKRYGRVRLWGSLGFLVTVLGAGFLFEKFGIGLFPSITALSLLAVVGSVFWMPDVRSLKAKNGSSPGQNGPSLLSKLKQPGVAWFFASVFFHVLAHMAVYLFFSLYLDAAGYSKATIGMLWAVSVLVEIGFLYGQGRFFGRLSLHQWFLLCALVVAFRMGITAVGVGSLLLLVLAQALHGLTFATHHTAVTAYLSKEFDGVWRGRGQALYTVIGYGVPGVLAGLGGGWVSQSFGLSGVFWLASLAGLISAACAFKLLRVWQLPRPHADLAH
jgi:MFS transporter, PPP family, 3-phenylpropionic acid transporter